jgi:hypothetical protein
MKQMIFLLFILAVGCSSTRNKANDDTAVPSSEKTDSIPACILDKIELFKSEDRQNPPRKIYSYMYKGQKVYYITPPCCDFFSELYDSKCVLIANPDGGFTGRGDGKLPDFFSARTDEKLLWEDTRKQ